MKERRPASMQKLAQYKVREQLQIEHFTLMCPNSLSKNRNKMSQKNLPEGKHTRRVQVAALE